MYTLTNVVINDKRKIRHQLQLSYSIVVFLSATVTLGICFLLLYSLAETTNSSAQIKITTQTVESVVAVSVEISNTLNQQLKMIFENVVLKSALKATILINYSNMSSVHGPLLNPITTYRDFNFVTGCQSPNCPSDFAYFTSSRLPKSFKSGSVTHPSIYLYSGRHKRAARNDSFWNQIIEESPEVNNVVNGLAFQDNDLRINYNSANTENVSCMYYLTAKIENLVSVTTNVVHRTFPGILLNESLVGDPTTADWFQQAPLNAIFLNGPYIVPATQQHVIVMSSRKTVNYPEGSHNQQFITFVSAGMMSLERLAQAVSSFQYTESGFGAVMDSDRNEMMTWRDGTHSVFNNLTNTFKTLRDFDALLANKVDQFSVSERQLHQTIKYTDAEGDEWLVSYIPFFDSQRYGSDVSYKAMVLLIFTRLQEANSPLFKLHHQIAVDQTSLAIYSAIIIAVTAFSVMIMVYSTVQYITFPLPKLMSVANEIIKMSTASEEDKDFSGILSDPLFALKREDEIGLLIGDYYQLLTVLQERSLMNRDLSQYPVNVFQIHDEDRSTSSSSSGSSRKGVPRQPFDHNWQWFADKMALKLNDDQRAAFAECTLAVNQKNALFKMPSILESDETSNKKSTKKPRIRSVAPSKRSRVTPVAGSDFPEEQSLNSRSSEDKDVPISPFTPHSEQEGGEVKRAVSVDSKGDKDVLNDDEQSSLKESSLPLADSGQQPVPLRSDPTKQSKRSKQSQNAAVSVRHSLRTQFVLLFVLLLVGCVFMIVFATVTIDLSGAEWSRLTEIRLRGKVTTNLQAITDAKAAFVKVFFMQLSTDTITLGRAYQDLLQGTSLRPGWYNQSDLYLRSYANDLANPYHVGGVVGTTNYSGYSSPSTAQCELTPNGCDKWHNSIITRQTSILDINVRSFFRPGTALYFLQSAVASDGAVRYMPYRQSTSTSNPITCYIQDQTAPHCAVNFANSSCTATWVNPANPSVKKYPPYDVRCRSWYQRGRKDAIKTKNFVSYLTVASSDGAYVLTATTTSWVGSIPGSTLLGAINLSYRITSLAQTISNLDYFHNGYCYLVRANDATDVMVHPRANNTCTTLTCMEGFSIEEYAEFYSSVLAPLTAGNDSHVATTYMKNGQQWQLAFSRAVRKDANFILIATLPVSEILETSNQIDDVIDNTLLTMIITFAFAIFVLIVFVSFYAREMINSILNPIDELRKVFELVRMNEDLSGQVPEVASSQDMRVLLDAFSKMMTALRFSNESYTQGNQKRAHEVYTDALSLYTGNNDKRGIGISLANLAASELARQRYDAAESLFKKAIDNADEILMDTLHPMTRVEENKMERVLSDRKASLAAVYLQNEQLDKAMDILTAALKIDIMTGYLIGYALKQGLLSKYHMQMLEYITAENILIDLLKLVRSFKARGTSSTNPATLLVNKSRVLLEEIESAEQITLCKLALLKIKMGVDNKTVESALIHTLCKNDFMNIEFVNKALVALKKMFTSENRKKHIQQLNWLAAEFNLNATRDTSNGAFAVNVIGAAQPPKRVVFCLDHSVRMTGVSFLAVVDNINSIFELHQGGADSMCIMYFSEQLSMALPFTIKKDNELKILNSIESLPEPRGHHVAMYDAVMVALYALSVAPTTDDWLVLVTCSDDTQSRIALEKTMDMLLFSKARLIIIGIGDHVQTAALELMASSVNCGVYFHAQADKKSINEAFDHATQIMEMNS